MEDFDEDRGMAPKIFFVAPDPTVVSDAFLETAFLLGYETYALADDFAGELRERVELLIDSFEEILLFFTIDQDGSEEDWATYLGELQQKHAGRVQVGVLYQRTLSSAEEAATKRLFLLDAGLTAGCVGLYPAARKNQQMLLDVLAANQAGGRRKRLRMRCHAPFGVSFADAVFQTELIDLSVTHFSAAFSDDPSWDLGTRINRVQLKLGSQLLTVNVLVGIKRMSQGRALYVFLFHPETGQSGLGDLVSAKINVIIYRYFRTRTEALISERSRLLT